jgi:aminobenzoyl-glutamate utilization protein B
MQEFKSCGLLKSVLTKYGFRVQENVAGMPTAFAAAHGEVHPVIAVNCEYAALPGLSQDVGAVRKHPRQSGAPGCGHNLQGGTAAFTAAVPP